MSGQYARFVTEPSQHGDGPPDWPVGADRRIVGVCCPACGHEERHERHHNAASFGQLVRCSMCGWHGKVPM